MWYVKHPFDCIVMGACAVRDGGGPHSTRVRQPDCRGQGGLFPHTAPSLLRQRPSCSRADVRAQECGKQSTLGGLVLPQWMVLGQESKPHATHTQPGTERGGAGRQSPGPRGNRLWTRTLRKPGSSFSDFNVLKFGVWKRSSALLDVWLDITPDSSLRVCFQCSIFKSFSFFWSNDHKSQAELQDRNKLTWLHVRLQVMQYYFEPGKSTSGFCTKQADWL